MVACCCNCQCVWVKRVQLQVSIFWSLVPHLIDFFILLHSMQHLWDLFPPVSKVPLYTETLNSVKIHTHTHAHTHARTHTHVHIRGVTVHKIHGFGSIWHSGVTVRYVFDTGERGNWLCRNVGDIYVLLLNHEGEPMDITQALVCTMVCKLNAGEHLNQSNHYKQKVKV